jgi:hypothetical protein
MALGLTPPETEMGYQKYFFGRTGNLTTYMCQLSLNLGTLRACPDIVTGIATLTFTTVWNAQTQILILCS